MEKKANQEFYVKVDTDFDLFNVDEGFYAEIMDEDTGEIISIEDTWEEIIRSVPLSAGEAYVVEPALTGSITISISGDYTLDIGDVFEDSNGNAYYIENINQNKLYLRQPVIEDIHRDTILTEVGNTGIYRCPVIIDEPGEYIIIVRNPEFGMDNQTFSITIRENNIDDIAKYTRYKGFV